MNLDDVFKAQIALNERLNPTLYKDIEDPETRRRVFLQFELALRQESAEAVDSLNWKWWKHDQDDWDNIKIELIDMLHFWVSMASVAGLTAADVFDLYAKKNKLNHTRQDGGYATGTYDKYKNGIEDNQALITGDAQ